MAGNSSNDTTEPQSLVRKWYFSRQEIEDHSPSRKDGVKYEEESEVRKKYCSFLHELGEQLNVAQVTRATAMMLCHRFYMRQSHAKNDWQTIATASMFLACKVDEAPRWLNDVVVVSYKLMYRWDPSAPRRIRQKDVFDKQKDLIVTGERILLSTIAFDLNIEHPYKPLVVALKKLEILNPEVKKIAQVAWNFVNDWLLTTLSLQYKPHYIAAGSMFLAAKLQKVKLTVEKGKVWWMLFDVSPKQLEEVIQQMLGLLEKNQKRAQPTMRGKVMDSKPTFVKAIPNIPQSAITSGSNVTLSMGHGVTVDAGGFVKSATPNSSQSCIVSGSNVADSSQSCIVSGSHVADYTGHVARVDSGGLVKTSISSSPQSCIASSSSVTRDTAHGALVDAERLVKSAMSKCSENEASSGFHVSTKRSLCRQTSDCSTVEDSHGETKARESDHSSSQMVSVHGGDKNINVIRIREALKRRRDRSVNKKLMEAMNDETIDSEAWIERELENGIELETASVAKRRRV